MKPTARVACLIVACSVTGARGAIAAEASPAPSGCVQLRDVDEWRWRLAGILIGPRFRAALFARVGETRVIQQGGTIDHWRVTAIAPHRVTINCDGSERVLAVDGFSPAEAAVDAAERAAEAAARNERVVQASRQQQVTQRNADAALAEATRRMTEAH